MIRDKFNYIEYSSAQNPASTTPFLPANPARKSSAPASWHGWQHYNPWCPQAAKPKGKDDGGIACYCFLAPVLSASSWTISRTVVLLDTMIIVTVDTQWFTASSENHPNSRWIPQVKDNQTIKTKNTQMSAVHPFSATLSLHPHGPWWEFSRATVSSLIARASSLWW